MNSPAAPAWLIAGNLAAFLLGATYFLSPEARLSHHWIMPLLEGLVLIQAALVRNQRSLKALAVISAAILSVSLLRIETIYLSRHLIHFSLAWAVGGIAHLKLRTVLRDSRFFRQANTILALVSAFIAVTSCLLALRQGIWWGIGPGA